MTHVFHLAAQAGVRKSWGEDFKTYTDNNVEATQRCSRRCVGRPLERFVYASSSSVYGDRAAIPMREDALPQPVSPYGVTKLAAEQLCYLYHVNYGVPTAALRYFTVYGPRQRPDMAFHRFIRAALDGEPIALYGDGEQTRDFTFVADAVAATIAAGERGVPGRAYNIGGGSRVSMNQVLRHHRADGRPSAQGQRARTRRRGTCATPTPTRPSRGRISASRPSLARRRIQAEYRWLSLGRHGVMTRMTKTFTATRLAIVAAGARSAGACAGGGPQEAAGRHARARQVPVRARHRGPEQETLARRARVLPPADRQLSAEPVPRRRQARARRHLPRRALGRVVRARRSTSSASS